MPVTILEITNWGSRWGKRIVCEHKESLGAFRKKLQYLAQKATLDRYSVTSGEPFCYDDILRDIEDQLQDLSARYQILDLGALVTSPPSREIGTILREKLKEGNMKCPKCGAEMSIGGSHIDNPYGQWECHSCGYIEQKKE